MTTPVRVLPGLLAGVLLVASLGACGGTGEAVTSSHSLDELGQRLTKDGNEALLYLAGTANAQPDAVDEGSSQQRSCPGGSRRTYHASYSAPTSVAGGDHSEKEVRGVTGMAAQVAFSRGGYRLATKPAGETLPATLEFSNHAEAPDQERTFRTTVTVDGDRFTTTITGQTACIRG